MTDQPITQTQLNSLEKAADKVFGKFGIDIEFSRHFLDRVNDERNIKQITIRELGQLFAKEYQRWGKTIAGMPADAQAVMKDLSSAINIPFVLNPDGHGKDLVAKTVMRKKQFHSPDRALPVESVQETESLNVPTMTISQIADKHGVSAEMIKRQLKIGIEVEKEHTTNISIATEIALDHLAEMPDYYSHLANMEHGVSESLLKGAWECEKIRMNLDEKVIDPREAILNKALKYLDAMVNSKGDKQDVGGYAFDITRSFNLTGIATAKQLEQLYHDWKGTTPRGGMYN